MNKKIEKITFETEQVISQYGHYLTMKDAEKGVQRLGSADILLVVLSLISWTLAEFIKAYVQEKGKILAQKNNKSSKELEKEILFLLKEVNELNRRKGLKYETSEELLLKKLKELDFTQRTAKKITEELKPIFDKEINEIIKNIESSEDEFQK